MSRVVVHSERHVGTKHRLKVERGDHLVEAKEPAVVAERSGVALRSQQGRSGQKRCQPAQRLSSGETVTPRLFELARPVPTSLGVLTTETLLVVRVALTVVDRHVGIRTDRPRHDDLLAIADLMRHQSFGRATVFDPHANGLYPVDL